MGVRVPGALLLLHGRRDSSAAAASSKAGSRNPTVRTLKVHSGPVAAQDYPDDRRRLHNAAQAWTLLIASWWTRHPAEKHDT